MSRHKELEVLPLQNIKGAQGANKNAPTSSHFMMLLTVLAFHFFDSKNESFNHEEM